MTSALTIGFVGCGRATLALHLPALAGMQGIKAVAVCDVDSDALAIARNQFGIAKTYSDHRDLIADPAVHAIAVCTPVLSHADAAIAALSTGKPTFIEKPLALTVDDCDKIIVAASNRHTPAAVGHNLRCHTLVQRARECIAAGEIGRVQMLRSVWTAGFNLGREMPAWRHQRGLGGGALTELGIHHIDLWRFLTRREVAASHAFSFSETSDDQAVALHGVMDDGTLCSTTVCQRSADSNEIEIFGDQGRLRFSVYQADSFVRLATTDLGGGIRLRLKEIQQRAVQFPALLKSSRRGGAYIESYSRQWRRFLSTALGESPAACSLEDARAAVAVLCQAKEQLADAES